MRQHLSGPLARPSVGVELRRKQQFLLESHDSLGERQKAKELWFSSHSSTNPGTKVAEVRATDADDPTTANGEIRYSLVQDQAAFQIDSVTGASFHLVLQRHCQIFLFAVCSSRSSVRLCLAGVITCKVSSLDRETRSQYVVVVKAQDMRGMNSGSTATTSVSITIADINDNLASFVRSTDCSFCVTSVDDSVFS